MKGVLKYLKHLRPATKRNLSLLGFCSFDIKCFKEYSKNGI